VLSEREQINNALRARLDEVTERWGVKVTNVEIREIMPPRDVQDAMNRQLSAERNRRAVVTESTGQREAAVNVAEGEKQAAILRAEGEKQGAICGQRANAKPSCCALKVTPEHWIRSLRLPACGWSDHDLAVLRNTQEHGCQPGDQVHLPAGIYQHDPAVCGWQEVNRAQIDLTTGGDTSARRILSMDKSSSPFKLRQPPGAT